MRILAVILLAAASAGAATNDPPATDDQIGRITPLTDQLDLGVHYDPQADYDQGVLAAEEEIEVNAPTIWMIWDTPNTNVPPEKDEATGLPVTLVPVGADEPWHGKCMQHRAEGHNDTIRQHLSVPMPILQDTNAPPD